MQNDVGSDVRRKQHVGWTLSNWGRLLSPGGCGGFYVRLRITGSWGAFEKAAFLDSPLKILVEQQLLGPESLSADLLIDGSGPMGGNSLGLTLRAERVGGDTPGSHSNLVDL
jgi:hypothetical protein